MKLSNIFSVLLILLIFWTVASNLNTVHSQTDDSWLTATVKLSVCGDGVAEGREECDNEDLKNLDCQDVGYYPGVLSCDIACEFVVAQCGGPLPTPTPTPVPTSAPSNTSNTSQTSQQSTEVSNIITTTIIQTRDSKTKLPFITPLDITTDISVILPKQLGKYDSDSDGKIGKNEMLKVVGVWIEDNRKKPGGSCRVDLDGNRECDLVDFSILMYYVRQ